ncbi:MAG: hypothetical protein AB7H86_01190 [Blastocatellales bacterium]
MHYSAARNPGKEVVYAGSKGLKFGICLIILAVGVFYLSTIRSGHPWGDDFSLYILHAINIAEGRAYDQTGYLFNLSYPLTGPPTYPPVFPLLLTPIYRILGLNMTAMKVEVILLFLIFLYAAWLTFRDRLPTPYILLLIGAIGFNPYFWDFKDGVNSDLPFLPFLYITFYLVRRNYEDREARTAGIADVLLISLMIYLSYGIRSVGILIVPCLILYDLLRLRKVSAFTIRTTLATGILVLIQNLIFHSDASYIPAVGFTSHGGWTESLSAWLMILKSNFIEYGRAISDLWENGYSRPGRIALFLIVTPLAGAGYLLKLRERLTVLEIYLPVYLTAIMIVPAAGGGRYLFPVVPLYLFYALYGLRELSVRLQLEPRPLYLAILLIGAVYLLRYSTLPFGPMTSGVGTKPAQEMFSYIRTETGKDEAVIFSKSRALALFAGRSASPVRFSGNDREILRYITDICAGYLVSGPPGLNPAYDAGLEEFVRRNRERMKEVFSNGEFRIYKFNADLRCERLLTR